jgi:hypothetical protein
MDSFVLPPFSTPLSCGLYRRNTALSRLQTIGSARSRFRAEEFLTRSSFLFIITTHRLRGWQRRLVGQIDGNTGTPRTIRLTALHGLCGHHQFESSSHGGGGGGSGTTTTTTTNHRATSQILQRGVDVDPRTGPAHRCRIHADIRVTSGMAIARLCKAVQAPAQPGAGAGAVSLCVAAAICRRCALLEIRGRGRWRGTVAFWVLHFAVVRFYNGVCGDRPRG